MLAVCKQRFVHIGTSKTACIGFWMSLLMKMVVAFVKIMPPQAWPSCVVWHSIFCEKIPNTNADSKPDASAPDGTTITYCASWVYTKQCVCPAGTLNLLHDSLANPLN